MEPCDRELVAAALAGDRLAFSGLVDRYRDAVCGVAYYHLGSFDDVQDAAQEAFVQAYLRLNQLRDPDKFGPWLNSIAANVCRQALRKHKPALALNESGAESTPRQTDEHRVAIRLMVGNALKKLPDATRLTVTLSYINGYSHAEVADFLGVPLNTVRSRLQHAKKKLREEMIGMVSDVLHEGAPDPDFTWRVVEEAMRQAGEARERNATGDALRHYDEALAALDEMQPGEDQLRHKMAVLWDKAYASHFSPGRDQMIELMEQSLAIAVELGDRKAQADRLRDIGVACSNAVQEKKSERSYREALEIYRELGEPLGQGNCLMWLGSARLLDDKPAVVDGRTYYEQAIPFFASAGSHEWVSVCKAMLALLDEVGEELFSRLFERGAGCITFRKTNGAVETSDGVGSSRGGIHSEVPMLRISSPFWQVSHLHKVLDSSVSVGGSWSGKAFSYSYQPLQATVTIVSDSETVSVPAGTFSNCLLTEQVTSESNLPDDADDRTRQLNRDIFCGVVRAWYAPGVGLVRLHARKQEGSEGVIELTEYAIKGKGNDHMPLAIGNRWVYSWKDLPAEWIAKEVYQVAASQDDVYYVQKYSYAYRNEPST